MTSERECYVFVVLPGGTEFVTAGRFRVSRTRDGSPRGEFVYGRGYLPVAVWAGQMLQGRVHYPLLRRKRSKPSTEWGKSRYLIEDSTTRIY